MNHSEDVIFAILDMKEEVHLYLLFYTFLIIFGSLKNCKASMHTFIIFYESLPKLTIMFDLIDSRQTNQVRDLFGCIIISSN